jgi:hypothetical protein
MTETNHTNLGGELASIGFTNSENKPHLYTKSKDGKTYGVDENKPEAFYLDDLTRITDDPEDEYLQTLWMAVKRYGGGNKKEPEKEYEVEKRTEKETEITPAETMESEQYPCKQVSTIEPVQQGMGIVRPAVSTQAAIAAWKEYQELKKAILDKSDLQNIQGKDHVKKSGWRKFATFYNLTDNILEEKRIDYGSYFVWKVRVQCVAPNGRIVEGNAMCSSEEKSGARIEHDTYSTAHTRAKNRAISDMIGAGEVSAEEMQQ